LGCTGAAAAYRRELLDDVGLFDEALFAFYEDVDLDLRAQLRGWKCIYVPQARLTHYGGGSFAYFSPLHLMLFLRNRFLVLLKDFPLALLWLLRRDLWRQTVASLRWATGRIRSDRGFLRAAAFLLQLGHGTLRRLPGAVLKRFKIQSRATLNSRQLQHLLVKSEAEER
jgi:GT2 family glycosyltransferase